MDTNIGICRRLDGINQPQEEDGKQRITVSKQFKDKVVKPILKVNDWLREAGVRSVHSRDISVEMNFWDESTK